MASRRLPGSREPGRTTPLGPRAEPVAPSLFDGETSGLTAPPRRRPRPEGAAPQQLFGARALLATAMIVHVAIAVLLAPRIIRSLDTLTLSLRPVQFVPLAAIGAIEFGLLIWAAWFRSWNGALTFCLLGVAWWLCLAAQILQ